MSISKRVFSSSKHVKNKSFLHPHLGSTYLPILTNKQNSVNAGNHFVRTQNTLININSAIRDTKFKMAYTTIIVQVHKRMYATFKAFAIDLRIRRIYANRSLSAALFFPAKYKRFSGSLRKTNTKTVLLFSCDLAER